ncbi:hypothetical protein AJ80_08662 [Polytolypa hystricis UAMH7299]|uniref:Uncharacterized protein n=1 Tax=Polytolypa hystricis (strain UAMH7299) TaxID=1447883 RepID=A0A2B7X4D8_POLH7|nr:hypothetical protein AJ80_08662 [Polytolypa hystricis UAMH7299]
MAELKALEYLIASHPLIDNHAHNLLSALSASDYAKYPFESVVSEAQGEALTDQSTKTLAHLRALKQLAEFYECSPTLDEIKSSRDKLIRDNYELLVKRCLEGTQMLLLDDGLNADDVEQYPWHNRFTPGPTKRIVRIETIAAELAKSVFEASLEDDGELIKDGLESLSEPVLLLLWARFRKEFSTSIQASLNDPDVVSFKSVICYRSGLNVESPSPDEMFSAFQSYIVRAAENGDFRINHKPLNDHLVLSTLRTIAGQRAEKGTSKPIQFHTGLGDTDINLRLSNPAFLQGLIEKFSRVDFVLLHSAYPYTREAGYLASSYPNTYLDVGEVFPMTSRDAQESILRQSLELVPSTKILWSTDGHYHPETYWLANKQFREALNSVLSDYLRKGDYTLIQATDTASEILFQNSNRLYNLNQGPEFPQQLPTIIPHPRSSIHPSSVSPSVLELENFLRDNPSVEFIWMQFIDNTATVRLRMLPIRKFRQMVLEEERVTITSAVLNVLQTDVTVGPDPLIAGSFYMKPDLSTLCRNVGIESKSATVMTFWQKEDGSPFEGCPRTTLRNIVNKCHKEHGISILCGFEIELVFMKQQIEADGSVNYVPWTTIHSWSNMTSEIRAGLPSIENIVRALADIDIHLEQFHAESSPGQFEFVLPPSNPLTATDTLIKARQTIVHVAEQHGLRATLYPRPYATSAGTAAHVHLSISPTTREDAFLAGMLAHLPAVLAFTFPQSASYERVRPGIWAGGTWVAWGNGNRETPIRKIYPGRWEWKSMDGLANPYLGVASIISAGYLGLKGDLVPSMKACNVDTATLTPSEREALSITTPMPLVLEGSIAALRKDPALIELMGKDFTSRYIDVRLGEMEMLEDMPDDERRSWLIARY